MMISLYDWLENTVGKGENAGYQHFLLFPYCFPKPSSLGPLKVRILDKEIKLRCLKKRRSGIIIILLKIC